MFTLIFFILLTIFLLSRLNALLGMQVGIVVDKEKLHDDFNEIQEVQLSDIDKNILQLQKMYPHFQTDDFIDKAQKAFALVFTAYAKEDKKTLSALLSKRILKAFELAIDDRKKRGEKLEGEIIRFISTEITDVQLDNSICSICVKFETEQSNILRDAKGNIIEGDPNFVQNRTDIWLFSKDLSSDNPSWYLEEIKTE